MASIVQALHAAVARLGLELDRGSLASSMGQVDLQVHGIGNCRHRGHTWKFELEGQRKVQETRWNTISAYNIYITKQNCEVSA